MSSRYFESCSLCATLKVKILLFAAFTSAVGDDRELQHAYQKEIKKEVESRLEKDSDYKPEQFPNTREYFDRRSRRK